eukprot:2476306-Prymnesium_polylepis.2
MPRVRTAAGASWAWRPRRRTIVALWGRWGHASTSIERGQRSYKRRVASANPRSRSLDPSQLRIDRANGDRRERRRALILWDRRLRSLNSARARRRRTRHTTPRRVLSSRAQSAPRSDCFPHSTARTLIIIMLGGEQL